MAYCRWIHSGLRCPKLHPCRSNRMTNLFIALLDFIGTFAFAISGALVAVRHRLDLIGVLGLSFAAATAGGIARDLALGATPPLALVDWRDRKSTRLNSSH